jgi:hypothetical protein
LVTLLLTLASQALGQAAQPDARDGSSAIVQLTLCFEAECLYARRSYPSAARAYTRLLDEFPSTPLRTHVLQRLYDIGNGWLDDTRKEMALTRKKGSNRWRDLTHHFHFSNSKPLVDEEGRAVRLLNRVIEADPQGPLADKALFLTASVHFFRNRFDRADVTFSRLVEEHPPSPLTPQAANLAIISKCMISADDPDFGKKRLREARRLIVTMYREYPEYAAQHHEELRSCLGEISKKLDIIAKLDADVWARVQTVWGERFWDVFRIER